MDSSDTPTRRRWLLALAILLLVVATACSGSDDTAADVAVDDAEADTAPAGGDGAGEAVGFAEPSTAGAATAAASADAPEAEEQAAAPAEDAADTGDDDVATAEAPPLPVTASTGERIIKEGTVTLEVEPGDFDVAFGQVVARAQALGGHVSGSSSSTGETADGDPLVSGQVTLRIPVRAFEDLLTSLGQTGQIVDRQITSQDVTAEYTDLESRLRNLRAQEAFYLGLLAEAQSVPDAIAVQQQLDGLQSQIEQAVGRLNLLGDRTTFSTLTVRIDERGAAEAEVVPVDEEPTGLTPYVRAAVDTLVATIGWLLIVLTFALPFLVLALLGLGVWRVATHSRRSPSAAPPPHQGAAHPSSHLVDHRADHEGSGSPSGDPVTAGAGVPAEGSGQD